MFHTAEIFTRGWRWIRPKASATESLNILVGSCLSQFQLGTSPPPPATPGDSLKKIARGVGIWLLKVARGPGIRQRPGFCGKFKLCLTLYKCVLRRRFEFLVFNKFNFWDTLYEGWFGSKDFIRQCSIYWGELPASPPQKKSFFCKKLKAVSNTDHIWRRY